MALTEFSSVISVFSEKAFNDIMINLSRQRPAMFNYGTPSFRTDFKALGHFCRDLRNAIHPVFKEMSDNATSDEEWKLIADMLVGEMDPFSIPGYTSDEYPFGIEWCMQITKLDIDIHPESVHSGLLPPELNPPLNEQTLSFRIQVCAGINCPGKDVLERFTPPYEFEKDNLSQTILGLLPGRKKQKRKDEKDDNKDEKDNEESPDKNEPVKVTGFPFEPRNQICTCIELFALIQIDRDLNNEFVGLKLRNLEIVDIPEPKGLEDMIECFIKTTVTLGVLPNVRFGIDKLLMELTNYLLGKLGLNGLFSINLTPISSVVPFNPALEDDSLKLMVTITII